MATDREVANTQCGVWAVLMTRGRHCVVIARGAISREGNVIFRGVATYAAST